MLSCQLTCRKISAFTARHHTPNHKDGIRSCFRILHVLPLIVIAEAPDASVCKTG